MHLVHRVAKLVDAAAQHFGEAGQRPGDGRADGEAGVTPSLAVNCNSGDKGRCVSAQYGAAVATDNPTWAALDFKPGEPHYFHYNFKWQQAESACTFTTQAFGDLDDDGLYSTFERAGRVDQNGIELAPDLFIDNPVE